MGFEVREHYLYTTIKIFNREEQIAVVWMKANRLMLTTAYGIPFIKLCLEYAETPIEEREEEKKYIVILPDPEQNSLHVRALCKAGINRVIIGFDNELIVKKQGSFRLTEAEIKRNHEYLWQLAKEVEDNE